MPPIIEGMEGHWRLGEGLEATGPHQRQYLAKRAAANT